MHVIKIGGSTGTAAGLGRWAATTVVIARTAIAAVRMDFMAPGYIVP
jgi:hypothetical protein